MLLSEVKEKQMAAAMQELVEELADSSKLEAIHAEVALLLSAVEDLSESTKALHMLNGICIKHTGRMYSRLSDQQLQRPDVAAALQDHLPLCPYLVDEHGKFKPKWKAMVNLRGVKLHLMCESFHGCHEVRSQKGLEITLGSPDQWLVKSTPVLLTALKLAFSVAIMAAVTSSSPVASFFLVLLGLNEFMKKYMKGSIPHHKEALPQFLSSYLEGVPNVQQDLYNSQALGLSSRDLLRQFYRYVLEGKDVDMERDFCLYRVYYSGKERSLWVCEQHVSTNGEKQGPVHPFRGL